MRDLRHHEVPQGDASGAPTMRHHHPAPFRGAVGWSRWRSWFFEAAQRHRFLKGVLLKCPLPTCDSKSIDLAALAEMPLPERRMPMKLIHMLSNLGPSPTLI